MNQKTPSPKKPLPSLSDPLGRRLLARERGPGSVRGISIAADVRETRQWLVRLARQKPQAGGKEDGRTTGAPCEVLSSNLPPRALLLLDDALVKLEARDEQKARTAELRLFGRLGLEEIARALGCSREAANREWRFAKLWLLRELNHRKTTITEDSTATQAPT